MQPKNQLSVVMITKSAQDTSIIKTLDSLPSDICVLIATDDKNEVDPVILKKYNAAVFYREFDDFSSQRNFILEKVVTPWVFSVDDDEVLDQELKNFLSTFDEKKLTQDAYHVRRHLKFLNKVLKWGKTKDQPIRLFKRELRYKHKIHEKIDVSSEKLGTLKIGHLVHESYPTLTNYFNKFNFYTDQIALEHFKKGLFKNKGLIIARSLMDFISRYFLRLGFLDGYEGFVCAWLSSTYALIKYAKLKELHDAKK